ncbi:glycosyltransferase family 39 protein [Rhodopseudomonas sp. BAL398]|nr:MULTISPECIES: glycosyltransferase family 39 protein [Rhodopseudomonas]MDF3809766.1 glycosyltransferase family 39 protein [Rhodopseudomonas sp. BAL398]
MRRRGIAARLWWKRLHDRVSGDLARPDHGGVPRSFWWLLAALAGLTAFRIVALKFSVVDLFFDESQYWAWAQAPAFGYFSKPPLLAWLIAATTDVCGNGEACIRSASPVFYLATSLVTYVIALRLYGARTAFWAGICIALAPGLVFSARIISTDVPLLLCWAVALLAYVRLLDRPDWRWSAVLGLALGFGLLAKYAMAYFLLGTLAAAFVDPRARALLRHRLWWIAVAIGLLLLLPNLIWVATHDFVTLQHVEANIDGAAGIDFRPIKAVNFLASQFAVFGPIVFAAFVLTLLRRRAIPLQPADRIMIVFALPPLVLVAGNAIINHANANWAAPSAISVTIVAIAILVRRHESRWLRATVAIGLALQILLPITDGLANKISLPFIAKPDIYARTMGWRGLAAGVVAAAKANGVAAIVADKRDVLASLIYYSRDSGIPVLSWSRSDVPADQFDLDRPLIPATPGPLLYVSSCPPLESLAQHYRVVERLPEIRSATGRHSERGVAVFKLSESLGNAAPLPPCSG